MSTKEPCLLKGPACWEISDSAGKLLSAILTLKSWVAGGHFYPSCPSFFPIKTSRLPLALNYAISTKAIGSSPKPEACG